MNRPLPPLSQLKAFEAAARLQSFKLAAEELYVTPAAISQHVKELESWLGIPLFERQTRKVVPTSNAIKLARVLSDGFSSFIQVIENIKDTPKQTINLSTTPAFLSYWLLPRIERFYRLWPQVQINFHSSVEVVDLNKRDVDFVIRYSEPGKYTAVATLQDFFSVVSTPRYPLQSPAEVVQQRLISFEWFLKDCEYPTWAAFFHDHHYAVAADQLNYLQFSDESIAIQATVAGQGIALMSSILTQHLVDNQLLYRPFPYELTGLAYHLLTGNNFSPNPEKTAFIEWLSQEFRLTEALHQSSRLKLPVQ